MKHAAVALAALALAGCQTGPTGSLSTGQNTEVIRGMYDSFAQGDITAVAAAMAPDVEWNEAENFIYADGNPYIGPDAVVEGIFYRVGSEWSGFEVNVDELIESGDRVVALGRLTGRYNATRSPIDAQFAHVWKLENGKVVSFQQYTDTFQVAAAVGHKAKPKPAARQGAGKARSKPVETATAEKPRAKKTPGKRSKTGR